jgi:acyl-CoA dehydrogenase
MTETYDDIRDAVAKLCANYPGEYWREKDRERAYPTEFVRELTENGYLSVLIPEEFGGSGLGIAAAAAILEEIQKAGCNGGACHAQMYTMGTVLRHGSDAQKQEYLPKIATGELRMQAFGVTEPSSGTDTLSLRTTAERDGNDTYVINGQKVWTSRAEHSDLMLLLARTTPRDQVEKRTEGLSVFLVDMREAVGNGLEIRPIRTMINHATTEIFFDNLKIPADSLVGEEGKGFRYILDGMNAERILIAAECIGDARWFIKTATDYANDRNVFGRPIGKNQGIQFPIAEAYMHAEAANLMVHKAAALFEAGEPCGPEANMAKCLAS